MRGLVRHLIKDHGYTRIAFISGPAGHEEANTRLRIVKRILAENGLSLNARHVAHGDFKPSSGTHAADYFVEQGIVGRNRSAVEVIIAANDKMAIAAVEALQGKSIRVPQDVAVVGFDDIDESLYVTPPLTTVRQPLFALGQQALRMALERRSSARNLSLPAEPTIRESCGCQPGFGARKAKG
jgi:DNA-binding LacI/PurR family transcriptional regulator